MNCKTQVALAAGIGYLLGRQRKLRWGLLLGAAAASGRLSRPGSLLDHGMRALKATPELGKLGEMGAPLVAATKDAAKTAVTGRIGSMSDRLRERTDAMQGRDNKPDAMRGRDDEPDEEPDEEGTEERAEAPERRPKRRPQPVAEEELEEDEDEEAGEDEDDNLVTAGAPQRRRRSPVRRRREE